MDTTHLSSKQMLKTVLVSGVVVLFMKILSRTSYTLQPASRNGLKYDPRKGKMWNQSRQCCKAVTIQNIGIKSCSLIPVGRQLGLVYCFRNVFYLSPLSSVICCTDLAMQRGFKTPEYSLMLGKYKFKPFFNVLSNLVYCHYACFQAKIFLLARRSAENSSSVNNNGNKTSQENYLCEFCPDRTENLMYISA